MVLVLTGFCTIEWFSALNSLLIAALCSLSFVSSFSTTLFSVREVGLRFFLVFELFGHVVSSSALVFF